MRFIPTSAVKSALFKAFSTMTVCAALLMTLTVFSAQAFAAVSSSSQPHITVSLVSENDSLVAGQVATLALRLQPDDGWHTYWKNPGDTGLPTRVEWTLPKGLHAGEIEWPMPERISYGELINFGFHGDTWLLVPISIPHQLPVAVGLSVTIAAKVKWLVCEVVCIPGQADLSIDLPIIKGSLSASETSLVQLTQWSGFFEKARQAVPQLLSNVSAEYSLFGEQSEQLMVQVALEHLPAFSQQPTAFFANAELVSNVSEPRLTFDNEFLRIFANKDAYLDTPIERIGLVITAHDAVTDTKHFYEVSAQYNGSLTNASTLSDKQETNNAQSQLTAAPMNLLTILCFALIGGLILNAMPCVFPVLSLKVISLVESGSQSTRIRQTQGLAYTAGVILSFLLVAVLLIALRGLGEQIGWGFQLQSPLFVGLLVYILFVLGLSMSGFIEIGSSLQNVGSGLTEQHSADKGWKKSFFTGVLATVVATPCTAPFMGTAMGFALSQPIWVALSVFTAMGLGLSLPFLLIAFVPTLANVLPRPGVWMVKLKEFLAFPIYLTAVWLLWVFARQLGVNSLALLLIGLVLLAFVAWLWRMALYSERTLVSKITMAIAAVAALFVLVVSGQFGSEIGRAKSDIETVNESRFSQQRLDEALSNNKTVFVNMTADWCITCKVNERVALKTNAVQQAFTDQSVVYLKGDWTNSDAKITQYLAQFNRNGVPLYVVYKDGGTPKVLPQLLTASTVVNAVKY